MEIHVVRRGDTIYNIANRYGVSPSRIIADNGIQDPRNLVLGQALIILLPAQIYTVRQGDTLFSIARRYGTTTLALVQNNPSLVLNPTLVPGQQITIDFTLEKIRSLNVNGYAYPYINRPLLRQTLPYLSSLTIFGYGFTAEGDLITISDLPLIDLAVRNNVAPVMLLSSITEDGNFSSERASLLFRNTAIQNRVIENVIRTMQRKGYVGLDIDFEYIEKEDTSAFLRFLENITEKMHDAGYTVNVDLAPKTYAEQPGLLYEAHDYAAHGEICDYVIIMTYEWGFAYGPPLPVAPILNVEQVIKYAVTEIPNEKILMGIPNYGYDWVLPYRPGTAARTLSLMNCVQLAIQENTDIMFDTASQSPFLSYYDMNGQEHITWFEDARSIQAKLELIEKYNLAGPSYWTVMTYFPPNWTLIRTQYDVRKNI